MVPRPGMWDRSDGCAGPAPGVSVLNPAQGLRSEAGYGMALFDDSFVVTPGPRLGMSDGGLLQQDRSPLTLPASARGSRPRAR